jgi:hypothetical protein
MKMQFAAAVLAASSAVAFAQSDAIGSKVIHNYSQVGLGYGYLHDIGNAEVNAHGVVVGGSYDIKNVVIGVGGGYAWTDDNSDLELWNVTGSLGYVFRCMENHINVIPSVGLAYTEVVVPHFNNPDTTTVLPGITLSYAFNSKFSINGGYKYGFEVDGEDVEAHMASVGAVYALTEQVEVNGTAYFVEEQGFSGVTAGVAYHF